MRVLVTGSRTWTFQQSVSHQLYEAAKECGARCDPVLTVVHGGCPEGADDMAHLWCIAHPKVDKVYVVEEVHYAAWREEGKVAGFKRNTRMAKSGIDRCLAFIAPCDKPNCRGESHHGSHGATHCADEAEKEGLPLKRFRV